MSAVAVALLLATGGPPSHRAAAAEAVARAAGDSTVFPLRVIPGFHYPVDSAGRPFLLQGDNPSSIVVALTPSEVTQYLDARKAQGFNTILFELIEHKFAARPPYDRRGEPPFTRMIGNAHGSRCSNAPAAGCWDFSAPNEAYWANVDSVIQAATARGFLIMVFPAYLGYGGGNEGWYQDMLANGPDRLAQYGRFLAMRYRSCRNVIWVEGGDYIPPQRWAVRAVADGIRSIIPKALQTAHASRGHAATEVWAGADWLSLNDIYTGYDVSAAARAQYDRSNLPFFLIEAIYENPTPLFPSAPYANEAQVRSQAYQAILSGAFGQIMGNNPLWYFGAGWQKALDSAGALSMAHLHELMAQLEWWKLEPDGSLIVSRDADGPMVTAAATATDRSFAVVYCATARPIGIRLTRLSGPRILARWYDPTVGRFEEAGSSRVSVPGTVLISPPGRNADGYPDWVLLLASVSGPPRPH